MSVISTRYDFVTEITFDDCYVTEFDCHAVLAADSDYVDNYWVEHLYVHASRYSHETAQPKRIS